MKLCVLVPTRDVDTSDLAIELAEGVRDTLREAPGVNACDPIVLWGNSIDNIRAELVCAFMQTDADVAFCLDDDVHINLITHLEDMLQAFKDESLDVLAAAYLNRHAKGFFTIPLRGPERVNDKTVIECASVTLGATLIKRRVFEGMYRCYPKLRYSSLRTPGQRACALFEPAVMPAAMLGEIGSNDSVYCGEDKMFCVRAHEAGFKLHAMPHVVTSHRGHTGCLSQDPLVGPMLRM